ncbi:hypothetical protein Bbelb_204340 [Branchiostoma belcheri]|nr:hypothetical protein Bbelb_204340 [Branchiostoma belcheri]
MADSLQAALDRDKNFKSRYHTAANLSHKGLNRLTGQGLMRAERGSVANSADNWLCLLRRSEHTGQDHGRESQLREEGKVKRATTVSFPGALRQRSCPSPLLLFHFFRAYFSSDKQRKHTSSRTEVDKVKRAARTSFPGALRQRSCPSPYSPFTLRSPPLKAPNPICSTAVLPRRTRRDPLPSPYPSSTLRNVWPVDSPGTLTPQRLSPPLPATELRSYHGKSHQL